MEFNAKISQNIRNSWLIRRAYKVALWLEMSLCTGSLSFSLSRSVFRLFTTFRLLHCLWHFACLIFPQSKTFLCDASWRLFPPKFHWVFFSSLVSLLSLSLPLFFSFSFCHCCVGCICINKLIITCRCCYHAEWVSDTESAVGENANAFSFALPASSFTISLFVSLSVTSPFCVW